jgi:hypothetical protein
LKAWGELGKAAVDIPFRVITGLDEAGKRAYATRLNVIRRHLSREQKRELIRQYLAANPNVSSRKAGADLGMSHNTVEAERQRLSETATEPAPATGQVDQLNGAAPAAAETPPQPTPPASQKRTGKNGKSITVHSKGGGSKGKKTTQPGDIVDAKITSASSESVKANTLKLIWEKCGLSAKAEFMAAHKDDFGFAALLDEGIEPEDLVKELYEWALGADQKEYSLNVAVAIVARLDVEALDKLSKPMIDRKKTLLTKKGATEAKVSETVS